MAAAPTLAPSHPSLFQRAIARGARFLARGIYRSVEVDNLEPGWSRHPVILVANHPTGFSDPALLLGLLERSPRFLAKSTLWKTPGLGWFLNRIGAIPIYRASDGSTAQNDEMFRAAFAALHAGDTIAIFPEGIANDAPSLAPLKTGAARLALGARVSGVAGLQIVPVGIHFEDKAAIRSRAYVHVGDVLDLDAELAALANGRAESPADHETVRLLTNEIENRLRASAPDHADSREARLLSAAAEVVMREPGTGWVSLADRQHVTGILAARTHQQRAAVMDEVEGYCTALDNAGVIDADLMLTHDGSRVRSRFWGVLAMLVVLAPFAAVGVILNALPYIGLRIAMKFRLGAMTPSTIRLFAAIAAFLAMWSFWAVIAWNTWDWRMALVVFIAAPLYGAVAVLVLDRTADWWGDWSGIRRARRLGDSIDGLYAKRSRVVATIENAMAS